MAILTHGSDLGLAPTAGPLARQAGLGLKPAIDALATAGFQAVQLDAVMAGLRPRDLDARARKDLLAMLTRAGVRLAGLDLFIPRKHFIDAAHVDRAMAAAVAAIELAADLGRAPLSLALPVKELDASVKSALVNAADGHGVTLAVHAEDQIDALAGWVEQVDMPALGMALDPAAVLARSADPANVVHRWPKRLAVARLSDLLLTAGGGGAGGEIASGLRCVVGEGDLSLPTYRVAVDLARARRGPVVLDLRGMENALAAATVGKKAWESAAFTA